MSDTSDPAKPDFSKLKIRDKEFNDESMQQITAWYKYYGDIFLESEIAQKLPAEVQEEFPFIVSSFSDFCYSYHLQKPGQWNKKAVHEVCAYIMPRKVMGNEAFFNSIIPGMSAFLQWAEQQEILTKTTDLRKALQSSEKELLSNSTNPNHWGIGKSLFMGAEASGVDFGNQNELESFIDNYNKNITIHSSNEKLIGREPKQTNEIHTLEDILEDLSYLLSGFPQAAIEAAINKKDEITPILLDTLDDALNHYDSWEDDDLSPLYAIYLLAKFREKQGFPKIMDILHLPGADSEKILGPDEVTGYAIKNIIASTFNGDLQRIYQLAEDKNAFEYARATAIESLLPLYTSGQISYETVIEYYRYLIESGLEKPHLLLWSILACSIMDLYATELYEPMKAAFLAGLVDPEFVRLNDFEKHFLQSKESVHAEKLYYHYHLIHDVVKEMSWWACFKDEEAPAHSNNNLMDAMSWEPNTTIHRELPKVGRNDTCPCGSGKKYKKCCLH